MCERLSPSQQKRGELKKGQGKNLIFLQDGTVNNQVIFFEIYLMIERESFKPHLTPESHLQLQGVEYSSSILYPQTCNTDLFHLRPYFHLQGPNLYLQILSKLKSF